MSSFYGQFYSYRSGPLSVPPGRVCLARWEIDGKIPHRYEVHSGNAPDAYGAMTIFALDQSNIILIQAWTNPVIVQVSADGLTYQDEIEVDPDVYLGSSFHRFAGRGFRIKNKTPSFVGVYQLVAFQ